MGGKSVHNNVILTNLNCYAMQSCVGESVITPLNKKAFGTGLILFFLVNFAGCLTDFFLLVLNGCLYGSENAGFVFSLLFWGCAFVAVYLWLLFSPNVRLNRLSKSGLWMLLLQRVAAVVLSFVPAGNNMVGEALLCLYFIGMLLFIWASYANVVIKVSVTAFAAVTCGLTLAFRFIIDRGMPMDGSYLDYQDFISQTVFTNSLLSLATSAVFFVLVTILAVCWRKK